MASLKRHQSFTDEEIKKKKIQATPKGTLKCDAKWNRVFRDYLAEKEYHNTEFWTYPEDELDQIFAKFWSRSDQLTEMIKGILYLTV